jgi:hypothetical protein
VASFANSWGGTLVVGMEANKLKPTNLAGIVAQGSLEENAVNTIRTSIAPVPAFWPQSVWLSNDRQALVVEVPDGTQTPYILIRTGQILIRTPTSSEPVPIHDRDALDRLFARGERGVVWAANRAEGLIAKADASDDDAPHLRTVPTVDGGLGMQSKIHRESFYNAVVDLSRSFRAVTQFAEPTLAMRHDHLTVEQVSSFSTDDSFLVRVYATGVVQQLWRTEQVNAGAAKMTTLIEEGLQMHRAILEDHLDHRGDVTVAMSNRWPMPGGGPDRSLKIIRNRVPVSGLESGDLIEALKRQVERERGYIAFEPEA